MERRTNDFPSSINSTNRIIAKFIQNYWDKLGYFFVANKHFSFGCRGPPVQFEFIKISN